MKSTSRFVESDPARPVAMRCVSLADMRCVSYPTIPPLFSRRPVWRRPNNAVLQLVVDNFLHCLKFVSTPFILRTTDGAPTQYAHQMPRGWFKIAGTAGGEEAPFSEGISAKQVWDQCLIMRQLCNGRS